MKFALPVVFAMSVLLPSLALGQTESPEATPPLPGAAKPSQEPTLAQRVSRLERDLQTLAEQVRRLSVNLTTYSEQLEGLPGKVDDLHSQLDKVTEQINNQLTAQQQVLDALTQRDSQGNYIPRVTAYMKSTPQFADEFREAVHRSLRETGTLIVENRMPTEQQIEVNGRSYQVQPGEAIRLEVPVGTVSTRLPGQELVNWTVGPPEYEEAIEIVPQRTVQKPAAPSPPGTTTSYRAPVTEYTTAEYPAIPGTVEAVYDETPSGAVFYCPVP